MIAVASGLADGTFGVVLGITIAVVLMLAGREVARERTGRPPLWTTGAVVVLLGALGAAVMWRFGALG